MFLNLDQRRIKGSARQDPDPTPEKIRIRTNEITLTLPFIVEESHVFDQLWLINMNFYWKGILKLDPSEET